MRFAMTIGAALAVLGAAACSSDGRDPMGPDPIRAAGTYDATFATTTVSEGCGGLVPTGETQGAMVVTEAGVTATLRVTDLTDLILNDPQGSFDAETGVFAFAGPMTVGDDENQIQAQGTIDGTFTADGAMDLVFAFTAFSCVVEGTIRGQRRA